MESTVLVKAFSIIEALATRRGAMSLAELTDTLSLNKPTIHRILQDLIGLGYVERVAGGVYTLTHKLKGLGYDEATSNLIEVGEPLLEELHESTQETTNLAVLQGLKVAYLIVLESPQPLRRVVGPGTMDPFYSTALGRAIVSRLPENQITRMLKGVKLRRQTANTIMDKDVLAETIHASRAQGYADEWEENDLGVMCVAVPICLKDAPVGAISLTVPTARIDVAAERKLVTKLKRTSAAVEKRLRGRADA